jgi:nickel transport protein
LLTVLLLLAGASPVCAHRLDAQCFVRPGWKVQVESWFETGDSPRGAHVQVFGADGQLLTEGKLDSQGIFVFPFPAAESLRVVVLAGGGHRAEVKVPATELSRMATCTCVAALAPGPWPLRASLLVVPMRQAGELPSTAQEAMEKPLADRSASFPITGAVTGVGFLLAVAVIFSWRTARRARTSDHPV